MSYYRASNLDKDLLAGFYMNSEQETRKQHGIPSGTVTFDQGRSLFTTDGKITFSDPVYDIKSIRLIVDLDTTTEDILTLSASQSVEVAGGTVTGTGISTPTIYVNGVAGATVIAGLSEIVITTATGFTADTIVAGFVGAYLEGKIELIEFWNVTLTNESVQNLSNDARYVVPNLEHGEQLRNIMKEGKGTFDSDIESAATEGANLLYVQDGAMVCEYVDDANGFRMGMQTIDDIAESLIVGNKYKISIRAKVNSGSSVGLRLIRTAGSNTTFAVVTDTEYAWYTYEFYASAVNDYWYLISFDNGEIMYIDQWYLESVVVEPTSKILHVTAKDGVYLEKTDQNTITTTDVSVFKDGAIRVMAFNGSSSLIESTLANNVNSIMFWIKPKTEGESIIDLGGGNTITIASDVLTAAWAGDLYVNGVVGTAIVHNEWNHVVCRVDSALALTDIDIGKISTAFFDGMLSDVIFVDGVVADAEISQVFSSTKMKYSK